MTYLRNFTDLVYMYLHDFMLYLLLLVLCIEVAICFNILLMIWTAELVFCCIFLIGPIYTHIDFYVYFTIIAIIYFSF